MAQSVKMVQRAEAAHDRELAQRNAIAWLQTINPANQPSGMVRLGDVLVRWAAQPVEPPRDAMAGYLQAGLYQVGLYRVRLELEQDGQPLVEMEVRRVGYKQVRKPEVL
ncbi:hypothetical protein [Thermomonas sp.]|uniref:hypothetical protein n=1 Tax=Thermomonas sp. TaxID=1971895 RepID=UPI00391A5ABB